MKSTPDVTTAQDPDEASTPRQKERLVRFVPYVHSFRMRFMLFSVLVSGLVLLLFGAWAWQGLHHLTGLKRLDSALFALAETQLISTMDAQHGQRLEAALEGIGHADPMRRYAFAIFEQGEMRYASARWPELPDWAVRPMATGGMSGSTTVSVGQATWRIAHRAAPPTTLAIATDLAPYSAEVYRLRRAFILVLALALVSVAGASWLLAWCAMRPLALLTEAAETVTAQALDQRIPRGNDENEFSRLIDVFNDMLERLERSFNHATRFSADAAHELKTPLAILQGQLDQALQEAPDGSPMQRTLSRLLEEVQRLKVIIRRLLLLSLADAGRINVSLRPMCLDDLLRQMIEDVEILAPDLTVTDELIEGIWVDADEALLQQAIQNLVNNAIKYNLPQGKIRFQLFRSSAGIRFAIANSSEGIPEEDRKQVFRRFYRANPARDRKVDGSGLGLSLAREILRAHQGKLWLADAPEGWVMFIMELPERKHSPDSEEGAPTT